MKIKKSLPQIKRDSRLQSNISEGRSVLLNLTKEQVVETLIAQLPGVAYAHILPLLSKRVGARLALFVNNVLDHADEFSKGLMQLSKAQLVDMSYYWSDHRLTSRYGGTPQATTPSERRGDVLRSKFVLRGERALDLNPYWARQFKKRDRKVYAKNIARIEAEVTAEPKAPRKPRRKPAKVVCRLRRESKLKTLNWIEAMRVHNRHITSESEPKFKGYAELK